MGMKVLLTFKQSEKWLYDEICSHSAKGNWVKDVLIKHLEQQQKKPSEGGSNVIDELI